MSVSHIARNESNSIAACPEGLAMSLSGSYFSNCGHHSLLIPSLDHFFISVCLKVFIFVL